jgi:hypothetical protein
MAVNVNVPKPQFQSNLRSKVVREALDELENAANDLQNQINNLTTTPGGTEVTQARDYNDVLQSRLRNASLSEGNVTLDGFDVVEQSTPDMTVKVKAGTALINGISVTRGYGSWDRVTTTITMTETAHGLSNGAKIYIDVSSATTPLPLGEYTISNVTTNTFDIVGVDSGDTSGSCEFSRYTGTLTAPTNTRYDLVVINSDGSLSVTAGLDDTDPVYGSISSAQRPLAKLELTSSTTSLTTSDIQEIKNQGCIVTNNQDGVKWYFDIQSGIDSLDSTLGGKVTVNGGFYYEEVDLSAQSNIDLEMQIDTIIYRIDDSSVCIKSDNGSGTEESNIMITGGQLNGNSKAGANELIYIDYTDVLQINDLIMDTNSSSTATEKELYIHNCDNINVNLINGTYSEFSIDDLTDFYIDSGDVIKTSRIPLETYEGASVSENAVFDTLSPYFKNTGDKIPISGSIINFSATPDEVHILTYMEKDTATTIKFYGASFTTGSSTSVTSITPYTVTDGSANNLLISISWENIRIF